MRRVLIEEGTGIVEALKAVQTTGFLKAIEPAVELELREHADVVNPVLLIERSSRFGANDLAARRVHRGERDVGIDHTQSRLDHVAAVVDFGDDAVGLMRPIRGNRSLGPICWRVSAAQIGEHVTVSVAILSRDHDAGLVGVFSGGRRRVNRHHDPLQRRRALLSASV
jgi:hypothetical protein